jgi:hypothetical protein
MQAPYLVGHGWPEYLPVRTLSSLLPDIGSSLTTERWRREDHYVRIRQWMRVIQCGAAA